MLYPMPLMSPFSSKLKLSFSLFIDSIDLFLYDTLYHLHRKYLSDKKTSMVSIQNTEYVEHDELDILILKKLTENARIPATTLASELDKPITTIISRIKNLEKKKVILGYTTILSYSELGLEYFKIEAKLNDVSKQAGILEYCMQHPHIIYFMKTTGNWDAEIFVEIENSTEVNKIIKEIQKRFPIRKIMYRTALKYYKFRYF